MIGRRRSRSRVRPVVPAALPRQDATGRRIDALARELAGPMSRRHALGVLGAAAAAATLPGAMRPRSAFAQGAPRAGGPQCGNIQCIKGATCCPAPDGLPGQCCLQDGAMECREGWCEPTGLCPGGVPRCGQTGGCCPDTTECVKGQCLGKCGPREERCGSSCCGDGEKCEDGKRCVRCRRGEEGCGKTCCPKGEYCCDPEKGLCCTDKTSACCYDTVTERGFCCDKPAECAREIEYGGAIRPDAKRVCCPKERVVPFTGRSGCCPAGSVSMGGALVVVPGGGDGGLCCREKYKCGDTCCANNQYFKQVCHKGRCVDPKSDAPVRQPGAGRR